MLIKQNCKGNLASDFKVIPPVGSLEDYFSASILLRGQGLALEWAKGDTVG
jgi:hypothetical protein